MQPVPGGPDERILAIYRDTIDALYRYVSRRCGGDRALAEDVTQETWLRAVREWSKKGPPDQPIAWLTTVARNLLVSYFRRVQPAALEALRSEETPVASDDGRAVGSADAVAAVTLALSRMPAPQAGLIETFHFDEHRMSEIARAEGVSERAVEGRLRRARLRLRRELESLLKIKRGIR
jgi:RNA polymerase sigma-70 factor (ECF subfamily)